MGRAPRVLLVDDDALFAEGVKDALQMAMPSVEVDLAPNGAAALSAIAECPPSLLVTDLQMPVMDGLELLTRLMARRVRVPVIVLTGFGGRDVQHQVLGRGAVEYFDKPIDLEAFSSAVRRQLDAPGAHVEGISLPSFAQLLQMEQKTCQVIIRAGTDRGRLLFDAGRLVDAVCGSARGGEAALEVLAWRDVVLDVRPLDRAPEVTVEAPLTELILEAARRSDEAFGNPAFDLDARFAALEPDESPVSETSASASDTQQKGNPMPNVNISLENVLKISGAIGAALVDFESGFCLGKVGGGERFNLDVAAAGNTEVVRAKMRVMKDLGLGDQIEDILITLGQQYHLIRPLKSHSQLFLYLAIDREQGNLAMARHQLGMVEKTLEL